jgi:hypothetical protein
MPRHRTWIRNSRLVVFAVLSAALDVGCGSGSLAVQLAKGGAVVTGCMTFDEIRDVERKADGVVEALRAGGRYAFLDLFGDPAFYPQDVREAIRGTGASIIESGRLADYLPLPFPLRHPKVLGHAVLIVGAADV